MTNFEWTIMVYLDADNNLEAAGIADFNEMEAVDLEGTGIGVIVIFDRISGYDTTNGNWTGTRLYRVEHDTSSTTINSELLQDMGEQDMSDPTTLQSFIEYAQTNYPADKDMLVLWNHGNGVFPRNISRIAASRGIAWDNTTGTDAWDCLTTDEVADALSNARTTTSKKIDIINMDACLMMMLEVAYEWKDEAEYLVGSEEAIPGYGNDYTALLSTLAADISMTTEEFTLATVDEYYGYYENDPNWSTTYSAIQLSSTEFDNLISAFSTFAAACNATSDMENLYLVWSEVTHFDTTAYVDLYNLAELAYSNSTDSAVQAAASGLMTAIDAAVMDYQNTGVYISDSTARGLSILLADSWDWYDYSGTDQYALLQLSNDTEWDEFVADFAAYSQNPPTGSEDSMTITVSWSSGDCDVAVVEPDGNYYNTYQQGGNGSFGADQTTGGTETWTLNATHDIGYYRAGLKSWTYTGYATVTVTVNSESTSITGYVLAGGVYIIQPVLVRSQMTWKLLPYKTETEELKF